MTAKNALRAYFRRIIRINIIKSQKNYKKNNFRKNIKFNIYRIKNEEE
jgi:hypothetical protein